MVKSIFQNLGLNIERKFPEETHYIESTQMGIKVFVRMLYLRQGRAFDIVHSLIAVSKTTPVFSMYSLPEFHREDLIRPKCLNDGFDLIRCQQIGLA